MAKKDKTTQLSPETVIGSHAKVKGNLVTEGDVAIDGVLNGNVKADGNITMSANGNVTGNLIGRNITISGTLSGNITALEDTHLSPTGEVVGDITTTHLHIEHGAIFVGISKMAQAPRVKAVQAGDD